MAVSGLLGELLEVADSFKEAAEGIKKLFVHFKGAIKDEKFQMILGGISKENRVELYLVSNDGSNVEEVFPTNRIRTVYSFGSLFTNEEFDNQFTNTLRSRRALVGDEFHFDRVKLAQEDLNRYVALKDTSVNNVTAHHLIEKTSH